jgi:cell division protein FtsB
MGMIKRINDNPESRRKAVLLLLAFIVVSSFFLFSEYGLIKRFTVSSELSDINESLENAYYKSDSLNKDIELMQTDINTIEKVAREQYGMIKPGEKVFVLDSSFLDKTKDQ